MMLTKAEKRGEKKEKATVAVPPASQPNTINLAANKSSKDGKVKSKNFNLFT